MKNFRQSFIIWLLALPLLGLAGCGGVVIGAWFFDDGSRPIDFAEVTPSLQSAITVPQLVVIRDIIAWDMLWRQHVANYAPMPALPPINFSQNMVAGIFLGSRPNSCYQVSILSVWKRPNPERIEISFVESVPAPHAVCATVITNPATLLVLPYSHLPVYFVQAG